MDNNNEFNQFNGFPIQNVSPVNFSGNFGNNQNLGCNCNGLNNDNPSCGCMGNNGLATGNLSTNHHFGPNDNNDNTTRQNLQRNLTNFLGRRVTCEFCNCGNTTRKTGVLSCVGNDFITLTGNNGNCLLCDTAGLNFVTVCG